MNVFDGLKATVFRTTTSVMGYECSWLPSSGSPAEPLTARVHYKAPAVEMELTELGSGVNQMGFMPPTHTIEYFIGSLPGLIESVRGGGNEYITITQPNSDVEIGKFQVNEINPIADGDTFKALLVPVSEIPQEKPTDEEYEE